MAPGIAQRLATALGRGRPQGWRQIQCCTLFFAYFRLQMVIDPAGIGMRADTVADVTLPGVPEARGRCRPVGTGAWEITLDALVDPTVFPGDLALLLTQGAVSWGITITDLMAEAAAGQAHPLLPDFRAAIDTWRVIHPGARPRLLDIGGRARSGKQRSLDYPDCDVAVLDIVAADGVDVVGDAHALSQHFALASFDFALSVAVFEHLAMPWKAAVEMARVLKPGGLALIFSHQTIGMHDLPWDFFRFSDAAYAALFNRATGFEIVTARMTSFMHIVPSAWTERHRGAEAAGGFEGSSVLVRKVCEPRVDWPVTVAEVTATSYPTG